jgi:beta-lactamase regulating signal transducer with metallopeptidase domain
MTYGTSLALIAIGAILRFAVTATTSGFSINTAGTILMVIGVVGLVISLLYGLTYARRRDALVERPVVYENDPRVRR